MVRIFMYTGTILSLQRTMTALSDCSSLKRLYTLEPSHLHPVHFQHTLAHVDVLLLATQCLTQQAVEARKLFLREAIAQSFCCWAKP